MSEKKQSYYDLLKEAKQAEADSDLKKAAELYETVLAEDVYDIHVYERLMILYRKQKLYKQELKTINKAIKNISQLHAQRQKKSKNKTIAALSKSLMKSVGLADKKGELLYESEPLTKWKKRKTVVEKKINNEKLLA